MKSITCVCVLIPLCFAASCGMFFSSNTGEEGLINVSLGDHGPNTGLTEDDSFLGDVPASEGENYIEYPNFEKPRVVVYNASGKVLRDYVIDGDLSSWTVSLPAGGPYWVDFTAPVQHPENLQNDPFPFVKSFGATVKVDAVEKGSNQELFLPLRVRETAILAPYMPGGVRRTDVLVPFFDLPAEYPAVSPGSFVDRKSEDILCFDIDPYGRLLTLCNKYIMNRVYMVENLNQYTRYGLDGFNQVQYLAHNLRNGLLYHGTTDNRIKAVPADLWEGLVDRVNDFFSKKPQLDSPVFAIDEGGIFYTILGNKIYRSDVENNESISVKLADIIDPAGQDWNGARVKERGIFDLKALNGYLYLLLYVRTDTDQWYDYFAALPLESIKNGNTEGVWFVGGRNMAQQGRTIDALSRDGFFGPKKFVGWGPDRIYVYDSYNVSEGFYRIVELDLWNRKISKAGLTVSIF